MVLVVKQAACHHVGGWLTKYKFCCCKFSLNLNFLEYLPPIWHTLPYIFLPMDITIDLVVTIMFYFNIKWDSWNICNKKKHYFFGFLFKVSTFQTFHTKFKTEISYWFLNYSYYCLESLRLSALWKYILIYLNFRQTQVFDEHTQLDFEQLVLNIEQLYLYPIKKGERINFNTLKISTLLSGKENFQNNTPLQLVEMNTSGGKENLGCWYQPMIWDSLNWHCTL